MNSDISSIDEFYMRRCLQLARCGAGSTSPNPMVGAVIVCDGRIIGEGYHIRAGEPHAEVNAVASVASCDRGLLCRSTIYVSLEPCSHYGKTPPCADLILSCGIPRVVVGVKDFNSQVNGGGIARLRAAGVDVVVGVLQQESFDINRNFFTYHQKRRPCVTLKWAESDDGCIDVCRDSSAVPSAKISTPLSLVSVHRLRAQNDAILVGTRTALLDNPTLNVRCWGGRSPLRLVVDKDSILPSSLHLFDGSLPTVVYTACEVSGKFGKNVEQVILDFSADVLEQILAHLHSRKISSLLVEGGAKLLQSFIDASLWDYIRVERNTSLALGGGVPSPCVPQDVEVEEISDYGTKIVLITPKKTV